MGEKMSWQSPGPGRLPGRKKFAAWKGYLTDDEWREIKSLEAIFAEAKRQTPAEFRTAYCTIRNRASKRRSLRA